MAKQHVRAQKGAANGAQAQREGRASLDTVQGWEEWMEFASCFGLPTEVWFPTTVKGGREAITKDPLDPEDFAEWQDWRRGLDYRSDNSWATWIKWLNGERGRDSAYNARAAKKICGGCYVRAECLGFALRNGERAGTWGGIDAKNRRPMHTEYDRINGIIRTRNGPQEISKPRKAPLKVICDCGQITTKSGIVGHQRRCGSDRFEELDEAS